jgi:hypothetical protein
VGAEVLYWPSFAPHVSARFREREWDSETDRWCEQPIDMKCDRCGDATRYVCTSGEPRKRVNQYAIMHLHVDVF